MLRTKKTQTVLKYCLALPPGFDSLSVSMFPGARLPLAALPTLSWPSWPAASLLHSAESWAAGPVRGQECPEATG